MDLRKMSINEWRDRARNRETWRHIVAEAKAHPGLEEEDVKGLLGIQNAILFSPDPFYATLFG